ncbi:MAG: bifunctional phosphopantothenoylcysteine decarboxylase/phosphopantothenate--cysteine ligase CoaBC [Fusobacteriaceae bacterium]|nr:bifunctional phosphopantothenoylcysteine decarboxylase/phosphopantothenate--cysteine ligase CoaBC [Fusobacteriaceae bacterium]
MKKKILIGVTGGIAAYKTANIVSMLVKKGFDVKIIMTENATKIITPLTLETLSRNRVVVDMWDVNRGHEVEHISLAEWADLVLVAPASYNVVGKVANGIADDMLTTVIAATKAPVFFALAMNVNMYENPILIENIDKLQSYGYNFIEADEGFLACNVTAKGRLKKEEDIVEIIESELISEKYGKYLDGVKLMITAGRTEEALDPVRYMSNHSSGKMGYSLARAAIALGAEVTLISGPTELKEPVGVANYVRVKSAREMYEAAMKYFVESDAAIACAAVADYRPKNYSTEKIKKKEGDLHLELERNPDILYNMGLIKNKQILVGFAAETENIIENATGKLLKKNLDAIVANHASAMQKNENSVTIIKKNGELFEILEKNKEELAYDILYIALNEKI